MFFGYCQFYGGGSVAVDPLVGVALDACGGCVWSLSCHAVLSVLSSFAIIPLMMSELVTLLYSKTCLKRPHKKQIKIGFQDGLSLNAGQSIAEYSKRSILQYF